LLLLFYATRRFCCTPKGRTGVKTAPEIDHAASKKHDFDVLALAALRSYHRVLPQRTPEAPEASFLMFFATFGHACGPQNGAGRHLSRQSVDCSVKGNVTSYVNCYVGFYVKLYVYM
jgi:hypothetical protein